MITLKQLEALYWISQLGTFERAAAKLNTTQSAISKRIRELEAASGFPLFDRNQRGARLTEKGEHLLALGQEMLGLRERILDLKDAKEMPARRLRFGVTELTALTWLPRFVATVRELYPQIILEPHVGATLSLTERLREDELDLIAIPETFSDDDITSVRLAEVSNVWMTRPGLVKDRNGLTLEELAKYPILTQGSRGGTGLFYYRWFRSQGITFPQMLSSDNLIALLGLAVAGVGISYLPRQVFRPLIDEGKLVVISTRPALPPTPYSAMYRSDRASVFLSKIADLMVDICDFSRQLQA
ncbi:LysR family transcriptional regulator [Agaricicola taiwanensis]|uniref:LysR family transcriptional regulator n=1 Tax=Agaricicola taiwanensis TaxID=591372 RepID=A0A8J3DZZ9_9RHOB|nr:LysR family transcriptional regulator [Agaricicola taiwanensis]GGE49692.1 LysR family transcriptional regulator [Agaricicola taiwanensis]